MLPETRHVLPTVWVADDDSNFLELFRVAAGFTLLSELLTFKSGSAVRENVSSTANMFGHNIFFLDVRMETDESGFDTLRTIRQHKQYLYSPVIVMSSSHLQSDVLNALRLGANCFFYKPVGTKRRVEAIRSHIEYWTQSVTPLEYHIGEDKPTPNLVPMPRARGTAWYAVDRLRQDLLVAILRDLDRLSAIDLPSSTKQQIKKCLVRLAEVFRFRGGLFGPEAGDLVQELVWYLDKWVDVGSIFADDTGSLLSERKLLMDKARQLRLRLSSVLRRHSESGVAQSEIFQLDYLIWDVFIELAQNPEFQYLFSSLERFQRKAF